ncbi:BREX-2 system adenine-specific DNA-methyltransferase PglX [Streptomyces sp. NPDC021100]|uniref:BREX-2 system adenine-specific DNA-methyltransferase PglX n=1 Tax=Streptomyces sp. NPDC021100 TaxID=3365114 RepID=UPI00379AE90B
MNNDASPHRTRSKAAGRRRLESLGAFPINIAVGDSLLHGRDAGAAGDDLFSPRDHFQYGPEDVDSFVENCDLLGRGTYHVVVGNPPYIPVEDEKENENYRTAYETCSGNYHLSVPFAQRIFELAVRTSGSNRQAGFTGQITANGFMKRDFGRKLISWFHQTVDLTHVIDTSGAHIPGHGTPTVILVGRNRIAYQGERTRVALGIQDEPNQPEEAAEGFVWNAIKTQLNEPGSDSPWISVEDFPRDRLANHPWSLAGGGAADLVARLNLTKVKLKSRSQAIGRTTDAGEEAAWLLPDIQTAKRLGEEKYIKTLVTGEFVRDFLATSSTLIRVPYVDDAQTIPVADDHWLPTRPLWTQRTRLRIRETFGKTLADKGRPWYEHMENYAAKLQSPLSLTFSDISTHFHCTLVKGQKLFNRSAPVIKLKTTEIEDHFPFVGILNSSTVCFWLKQVSQPKAGGGIGRGIQDEPWEERYQFTAGKVEKLPLPEVLPSMLGRSLDSLAQKLAAHEPSAVCTTDEPPTRSRLDSAHDTWTHTRQLMIALQEELDWEVYHSYGLLTDAEKTRLTAPSPEPTTIPQVRLGERAFEIVLARKQAAGELETAWFDRHGSTPITEIPAHWPDWYQDIVQARIDTITSRRDIALIERPECKRRWSIDPWEKREKAALRTWLLDRCEDKSLWFHVLNDFEQPRTLTVGQLADELEKQPDAKAIINTASLYAAHLGKPNLSLTQVLQDVVDAEHVPYLAAYRYKDTGLRKRAQWEDVWEQQREEDRTGERRNIPVPPKYTSADFQKQSYWSNRGKLDVPKERFISYPDASPGSDPTLLLGWAGWDQRGQATALLNIISERREQQDWSGERLVPLLAGINELMPWLRQWFGEVDDEWGEESAAEEFQSFLDGELARDRLTPAALTTWRPAKKTRARKTTTTTKTAKKKAAEDDE